MIDIKLIKDNPEKVQEAAKNKGIDIDINYVLNIYERTKEKQIIVQTLREDRNKHAKAASNAVDNEKVHIIEKGKEIKIELEKEEAALSALEEELKNWLHKVPNIPAADVPLGKDESENVVIRKWGQPKQFDFKVKDHIELGKLLDGIDIDSAAKVSGSRFTYLKGDIALLEFALLQYAFSVLLDEEILKPLAEKIDKDFSAKPFIPVVPPVMIRPDVFEKMARKDPEEERYYFPKDDLFLIGSAEHTLGSFHMDQTLYEKSLPIRYVGFSTSFRREAGSYGKDTKGIIRVHQFDKVEMESFSTSENSLKEQDFFVSIQEYLMQSLEIPYQVVMICTGDMGVPDARQIDIESWIPSQNKYRETHTSDLMTDYQSRRLQTKVRKKDNTTEFVHMNDATAFAIGRTIVAILENYQQEDGSVKVPKVLQKFLGKAEIKPQK
ncbi:MAG: serine--tRNA ligase [Candidatus Levybacteria bacterium RIFCSPHIGHO2_12_FULL_38_12]|nr:MAG: serine--tRNA ligase [Candidatus Levybacteria bacterium RIFCSPHIGHO2_01_FULL_38_12]OGH22686.1 MAG: serine--tRNA ligase [Candidatus Levybacteria bacterium RIFCSPHIGHO2_12_FULL_38_12]OGH33522.1 MAG: serine--tRNA ligase [Candidatus Levybacteria bacterium RIFCSPLOWO2_01_FULL_37_20]OGH43384.1 MAG: serine--tRNA ligase [Candidatus Levybacteria bacterium RIFCSPLOWO2_02_FULL_37_18]OGH50422.1 MAG: serine--tRNA ligase [Candidatus Levybacteria bacterium RIFCSPLOWO2_12_FULL_37_7]